MPVLCVFLVIACFFDYRRCRIPNLLLGALLLYGLLQSFINGGVQDFALFMGITLLVMLVFYPFFKIGCIGAGDVKLFGICAGFFPLGKILLFLFFSLLISAGISLFRMLQNNNLQERFFIWESICWMCFKADTSSCIWKICADRRREFVCQDRYCAAHYCIGEGFTDL